MAFTETETKYTRRTTENSNNRYSDYFSSLQNDNQSTEIFTDIDQYNDYQGTNDNNQGIDGNTVVGVATILKLTLPFIRLISMLDGD
jgi:hypothetical protein